MKKRKKTMILTLAVGILSSLLLPAADAEGSDKLIALTFDDGPGAYTEGLLDGLLERGVHVSFFMTGENAEWNKDTVKRAWSEGHQICCHTYDHAQLTALSEDEIKDELKRTYDILDDAIGYDLKYSLRPPYGSYNKTVLDTVGTPCYYWSVDTRDWESKNEDAAYAEFMKEARDGSIVLMHDIHKTTIPAALRGIDTLLEQGYEFVTLNELMVRRSITPTAGNIYFSAYPDEHGTTAPLSAPVISYEKTLTGKRVFIEGDKRARIYYTLNGETPDPGNSMLYTDCFPIDKDTEVRAICVYDWNGFVSEPASLSIGISGIPTLTISSKNGRIIIGGISGEDDVVIPNVTLILLLTVLVILVGIGAFTLLGFFRPKTAVGRKK